jgi:hypothetical protein
MTDDDLRQAVEDSFPPEAESQARRRLVIHEALRRRLGEPQLVTDPVDGITRPTWTMEGMSDEQLADMLDQQRARREAVTNPTPRAQREVWLRTGRHRGKPMPGTHIAE